MFSTYRVCPRWLWPGQGLWGYSPTEPGLPWHKQGHVWGTGEKPCVSPGLEALGVVGSIKAGVPFPG